MSRPLEELKTRARLHLNASRSGPAVGAQPVLRLRDSLHAVARATGFMHWEHAREVLSGQARAGSDWGRFWYAPRCASLFNPWFADHTQAIAARNAAGAGVLLPYGRHVVLANDPFLLELGMEPAQPLWGEVAHDLVESAGSPAWQALVMQRLRAMRADPAVRPPPARVPGRRHNAGPLPQG
jgi:hypothetical protein